MTKNLDSCHKLRLRPVGRCKLSSGYGILGSNDPALRLKAIYKQRTLISQKLFSNMSAANE